MTSPAEVATALPAWLPETARLYLRHVEEGQSLRELARAEGCHPSTILRKVRRFEMLRDDPLIDEALTRIGRLAAPAAVAPPGRSGTCPTAADPRSVSRHDESQIPEPPIPNEESQTMTASFRTRRATVDDAALSREALRILRRLNEQGAVLAVAPDLDKAVVLKGTVRLAVTDRASAQAFAVKDWIVCARKQGRVALYEMTATGRSALRRMLAAGAQPGLAEAPAGFAGAPFAEQHRLWGERARPEPDDEGGRRMRYNMAESPLALLARRREKDGTPFLSPDLVAAGERLREDFELAQMGPRVAQNWDRFLTGADRGSFAGDSGLAEGPKRARDRVAAALRDLGPGLGDMVLRCCCFLEGLEAAERRLGWSARSGKIVLRIALMRLKRHYEETYGAAAPLIG